MVGLQKAPASNIVIFQIFFSKDTANHVSQWWTVFAVDAKVDHEWIEQYMDNDKAIYVRDVYIFAPYLTDKYQYRHQTTSLCSYVCNRDTDYVYSVEDNKGLDWTGLGHRIATVLKDGFILRQVRPHEKRIWGFWRKKHGYASRSRAYDRVEVTGSANKKGEVVAGVCNRSAAVHNALQLVTYLYVEQINSSLTNNALSKGHKTGEVFTVRISTCEALNGVWVAACLRCGCIRNHEARNSD